MKAILYVLAYAAALLVISNYVPGISVASFYTALVVGILWGILSFTLKPLLNILALPLNLITLGLFSFVINALLFWLLATFVAGFSVAGFIPALVGSVILSAVAWALHAVF